MDCCPYFFTPFQDNPDCPLFIFLPGMDETGKELMMLQVAKLETAFDVRCFVIPAATLDSWDSLSQRLIALTQAELEKTSRQVYLCGESFGGCVALNVLEQAPELFDRIILINSASSFHRILLLNLGSFLLPWTPQFLYDFSSILALPFLTQITRLSPEARTALTKTVQDAPKQTAEQRLEMLRNFNVEETKLQNISQPVLLMGSQNDHILPSVEEVYRLAKIFPNAQVVTLPHSGHACLVESEVDLIKILQQTHFLPVLT